MNFRFRSEICPGSSSKIPLGQTLKSRCRTRTNRGLEVAAQGAKSVYQGANRGDSFCGSHIVILTNCVPAMIYGRKLPGGQAVRDRTRGAANYRKPPLHTRFTKAQSGNPRGRPARNLPALLAAALNEKMTGNLSTRMRTPWLQVGHDDGRRAPALIRRLRTARTPGSRPRTWPWRRGRGRMG